MIEGTSIANTGGIQAVQLSVAEMPTHSHTHITKATQTGGNEASGGLWYNTGTSNTGDTGGDGAHSNIPPAMILNFIIKT